MSFRRRIAIAAGLATAITVAPAQAKEPLLAPPGTCAGQASVAASPVVQKNALRCLVNYARTRVGAQALRTNPWLTRTATTKVRRVESCQEFSHTPCRIPNTLSGSPFTRFGEVIYAGRTAQQGTPRATLAAWLASPPHRRSLLNRSYRALGVGLSTTARLNGDRAWIWAVNLGR